ncbi:ATP--guanido phosphotransferase, partial [Opitutaceae bacterium]|nr:ATP--guanido phosphotransferase [Opitutaceae bacterium]
MPAPIEKLLSAPAELTDNRTSKCPVVLMTRIRLARNLANHRFPGRADEEERSKILARCRDSLAETPGLKRSFSVTMSELDNQQRQLLVERHLVSRELIDSKVGAGAVINRDQSVSVMINEEDHLRIQVLRTGFQLKKAWNTIDTLDTALESSLNYAFSSQLGYLTACPTNLGTGMRASAMMHLPALVIVGHMEKVVRAVNQLGMVVRGLFGEGSDASGSIFQISNQTTLGEAEPVIVKRLQSVLKSIVEHELNARDRLLENSPGKLPDKIGRAFGILKHGHL